MGNLILISQNKNEENEKFAKFMIEIEDNGKGISQENISKLFIDFGKLEEHQHMNTTGTGLGLSICKRIVEQMGGDVSVKSQLGFGTTFAITVSAKIKVQPS